MILIIFKKYIYFVNIFGNFKDSIEWIWQNIVEKRVILARLQF